ncbi:MAG TPA: hypothetical protein VN894_03080 [Polyangiaceae bacterium]|nr:hypothetical protein [Polyangiaceae bacterium]
MRASPLLVAAVTGLATARAASADDAPLEHPSLLDRPHTVAELELGIIALPYAAISPANQGGATPIGTLGKGDATLQTGVHLLYRATRDWAFGAGTTFAPHPTSDTNFGGLSGLMRTHSRSYLFLGGEVRYFPVRSRWFEGWFGMTGGVVVIADRFTTEGTPRVPAIFGDSTQTVSTEGFAIGVQAGADYLVTDQWVIGLALRADQWILPSKSSQSFLPFSTGSSCDPLNDCPTLSGWVEAIEVGVTVGYRISL